MVVLAAFVHRLVDLATVVVAIRIFAHDGARFRLSGSDCAFQTYPDLMQKTKHEVSSMV